MSLMFRNTNSFNQDISS
ncbi:hypothetical protein JIY74_30190 [Vibrio harveyi]|nr:hypothetical protein [Vibrio harveyi]